LSMKKHDMTRKRSALNRMAMSVAVERENLLF
jgi:hypothetical protein